MLTRPPEHRECFAFRYPGSASDPNLRIVPNLSDNPKSQDNLRIVQSVSLLPKYAKKALHRKRGVGFSLITRKVIYGFY